MTLLPSCHLDEVRDLFYLSFIATAVSECLRDTRKYYWESDCPPTGGYSLNKCNFSKLFLRLLSSIFLPNLNVSRYLMNPPPPVLVCLSTLTVIPWGGEKSNYH